MTGAWNLLGPFQNSTCHLEMKARRQPHSSQADGRERENQDFPKRLREKLYLRRKTKLTQCKDYPRSSKIIYLKKKTERSFDSPLSKGLLVCKSIKHLEKTQCYLKEYKMIQPLKLIHSQSLSPKKENSKGSIKHPKSASEFLKFTAQYTVIICKSLCCSNKQLENVVKIQFTILKIN